MKQLWIWYWTSGGYNSTRADTREEALKQARAMESAYLKVDEQSLHAGTNEELGRLDRQYASLLY